LAATSASATELLANGDFATHDFTGWTLFTTSNGSLGFSPDPRVIDLPIGGGQTVPAAEFQVGQVTHVGGLAGGGIEQSITTAGGELDFSAQIVAAYLNPNFPGNGAAGLFTVSLDGVALDSIDLGAINRGTPLSGTLAFSTTVTAGEHELQVSIERAFQNGGFGATPFEFISGASATQAAVPEPAAWALMIAGFGLAGASLRRRRGALAA
jgi:hypothetical protein